MTCYQSHAKMQLIIAQYPLAYQSLAFVFSHKIVTLIVKWVIAVLKERFSFIVLKCSAPLYLVIPLASIAQGGRERYALIGICLISLTFVKRDLVVAGYLLFPLILSSYRFVRCFITIYEQRQFVASGLIHIRNKHQFC